MSAIDFTDAKPEYEPARWKTPLPSTAHRKSTPSLRNPYADLREREYDS
jgi:hypothetical protein